MNRFFQALISRFLHQYLPGYDVRDEQRLKGMFSYHPNRNPKKRFAPAPRPDFVLLQNSRTVAVLDAKYRDLWENSFPRSMLYQLAIYALGHNQAERGAAILYPTLDFLAKEQSLFIQDALDGSMTAHIDLRPVNLLRLNELLQEKDNLTAHRRKERLAQELAFGSRLCKSALDP